MNEQHLQRTRDQISHQRSPARTTTTGRRRITAAAAPEGWRTRAQVRQQNRIAADKSGQLTKGETAHIERNEAGIHREVRADRAANGGKLTAHEHHQVEHQQNLESHQIYHDKHNAKTEEHPHGEGKR
jgi:hypothetical protein